MSKEKHNVEWKQSWRDTYIKWLCGFANAQGGLLVIGKNDAGEVVGVGNAAKLLEDIPNKVRDILGVVADVRLRKSKGLEYIEIRVEASPHPVSYKGQYHFRSGSTKQELKGAALDAFLLRKLGKHWDGVPVPGVKLANLSKDAIKNFGRLAKESRRLDQTILKEPTGSLLEKLGLRDGKYLKRAAVLLFHPVPESLITGAYTKIGFFRTNSDLRYQDEINGDLFTQVEKTIDVLFSKYLKADITYRGIQRIEKFPMPEAALREAVLNALIHKNYASGAPVQISVYADKLLIWNSGTLPPDWDIEKLMSKHASEPYNPDVANAFFRAGLIESWGRGIERILEACHEAETPEPLIRVEASGLWLEFPFPVKEKVQDSTSLETTLETQGTTLETQKTNLETQETTLEKPKTTLETRKTNLQTTQETTKDKITEIIRGNPNVTRQEIADAVGVTLEGVKYHLRKLHSSGVIRHVGPTKAGYWKILS